MTAVYRNIKHLASCDANQLSLGMVLLEMEAAKHTFRVRTLMILKKFLSDTCLLKESLLIGFHEVAAPIAMDIGIDYQSARNQSFFKQTVLSVNLLLYAIHSCVIVLIVAAGNVIHPFFMVEIPVDG